jgi:hypothetical protein
MDEELLRDYPEIKERLAVIEAMQQKDLDVAEEWRKRFCDKMDKILDFFSKIPCEVRQQVCGEKLKGYDRSLKFLWGVVSGMLISLILGIGANITVLNEIRKEISFIEQCSYGVQDYKAGNNRSFSK